MPDQIFEHPRLAAIYDALDPTRDDLDPYLAVVEEFGARRVADLGCGTGVLALLLAGKGLDVVGVDPAGSSLDVARSTPGATDIRWIHGDASALPREEADVVLMTGNAAQAVVTDGDWAVLLDGVHAALVPGGRFVFETRVPARKGWRAWTKTRSRRTTFIEGHGDVESWVELLAVEPPLVSFRWTFHFLEDGQVLTSDSTLRFRDRDEISRDLRRRGFGVEDVRDAPDRPGREFVFIARKLPEDLSPVSR